MNIDLTPFRFTKAYERRLELAAERGLTGDDPDLPTRQMDVIEEGKRKRVVIGPVEAGGPDEILWEVGFSIS